MTKEIFFSIFVSMLGVNVAIRKPFTFSPIFKEKMWGGKKIKKSLLSHRKDIPIKCGECWLLSGLSGAESVVEEGEDKGLHLGELAEKYGGGLLGNKVYAKHGPKFPLLIKLIDAQEDLSVQVHPDDVLARKRHDVPYGKTEMWYMLEARSASRLVLGLKDTLSTMQYRLYLRTKTILNVVNYEHVYAGNAFLVPAGTIHSVGEGLFFVEIQQASDITYRIYDFDRIDPKTKKTRPLHIEESLDAVHLKKAHQSKIRYKNQVNTSQTLVQIPEFVVHKLKYDKGSISRNTKKLDSFLVYFCISGKVCWEGAAGQVLLKKGECILVPAATERYDLKIEETGRTTRDSYAMSMASERKVAFKYLEGSTYKNIWKYQETLFRRLIDAKIAKRQGLPTEDLPHYLLFTYHSPVITLGKNANASHVHTSLEKLQEIGVELHTIDRGGDVTYHGPGQLVAYPILDLSHFFEDIHKYLRFLEEVIICTLKDYELRGERIQGLTGVWIKKGASQKKIAAYGVRCSHWVTMHGLAFNISTNLEDFSHIIPCGISDKGVTSLEQALGTKNISKQEVEDRVLAHFIRIFEMTVFSDLRT